MGNKTKNKKEEKVYLNFTGILYRQIGERVKDARKKLKATLDKVVVDETNKSGESCWIDKHILNNIENGKAEKKRNPYLLSSGHIADLSEKLNIGDKFQVVWGNEGDRKRFAKLILIAVLCNASEMNPFFPYHHSGYEELFKWAHNQSGFPKELRVYLACAEEYSYMVKMEEKICDATEIAPHDYPVITAEELKERINLFLENNYPFFYSEKNYNAYGILKNECDRDLNMLSDCLFNLMKHNYTFTKKFVQRIENFIQAKYFDRADLIEKMKDFYTSPSQYIHIVLSQNDSYFDFAAAFNSLWERNEKDFMDFFNRHIFKNDKIDNGLKVFQNRDFMAIIKSDEFYQLCRSIQVAEELTEPEAIISQDAYTAQFQYQVQKYVSKTKDGNIRMLDYLVAARKNIEGYAEEYFCF